MIMNRIISRKAADFGPFKVEKILKGEPGFDPITFTFSEEFKLWAGKFA